MRKIEQRLIKAIKDSTNFSESNTKLTWIRVENEKIGFVTLFGNRIAIIKPDKVILSDANWRTHTTKSRLNAIIMGIELGRGIYQTKKEWFFAGYGYTQQWTGKLELLRWQHPVDRATYYAQKLGYTETFWHEGKLWGYPPNGVMPVPIDR